MTGHSDETLSHVLWPDSELESLSIDYDDILIGLTESTGLSRIVKCEGYIGYEFVGFWDECLVESAEIRLSDELLEESVASVMARYNNNPPDTGSPSRNRGGWRTLVVRFSDGAELKVAAASFSVADRDV